MSLSWVPYSMSLSWVPFARELEFCLWHWFLLGLAAIFFFKKIGELLIIISNSTSTLESKRKIQISFLTIQRRLKTLTWAEGASSFSALHLSEPDKACRSRDYYSRLTWNHRSKAPKDRRTKAATMNNDGKHRSEESNLKSNQQTQKTT
jgi:hypothetical protein